MVHIGLANGSTLLSGQAARGGLEMGLDIAAVKSAVPRGEASMIRRKAFIIRHL
jgi:hypothetical protein